MKKNEENVFERVIKQEQSQKAQKQEKISNLLSYLDKLTILNSQNILCTKEINKVMEQLNRELLRDKNVSKNERQPKIDRTAEIRKKVNDATAVFKIKNASSSPTHIALFLLEGSEVPSYILIFEEQKEIVFKLIKAEGVEFVTISPLGKTEKSYHIDDFDL